ncbi:MAG: HipA family kinase [Bacteroidota bacterium]
MLPVVSARRYVQPLREGGSLPALVDTESGLFVTKFRGAGQGAKALIAEVIVGGLAQHLGLPVPELAVVHLDEGFGRAEPDPEIQDILRGSIGANVGLRFVPGAFAYDPTVHADLVLPDLAADIVWLDALTTNIDRTARNPNLLIAPGEQDPKLWLIDHGAALYFHHDWANVDADRAQTPFPAIRDHVLLPRASSVADADDRLAHRLDDDTLSRILGSVPDELLTAVPEGRTPDFETADDARDAYRFVLRQRLASPRRWVDAASNAQDEPPDTSALSYRR